jgi:hypothetical protein
MEKITVPYKVETQVATFQGEWTAEEIDAGLAGEPTIERHVQWFEPSPDGPVEVHDDARIAELEDSIRCDDTP